VIVLIKDSKKGVSPIQLARHLGMNKNTAWFLQHLIRKAMNETLEVDETSLGGMAHKKPVL
jgi:hypothetical protein